MMKIQEKFKTYKEAELWVLENHPFRFIDCFRFCYLDKPKEVEEYEKLQNESGNSEDQFDAVISINGRVAKIGLSNGY